MPLDRARAQGLGEPGDDRVEAAVDAGGEGTATGKVVPPDGVEPGRQVLAVTLGGA